VIDFSLSSKDIYNVFTLLTDAVLACDIKDDVLPKCDGATWINNLPAPGLDILRILAEKKELNDINFKKKIKEIQDSDRANFDFVYKETRDFCLSSYTLKNLEKSLDLLMVGKREESKKYAFEAYKYEDLDDQRVIDVKRDRIKSSKSLDKSTSSTVQKAFNCTL